MICATLVWKALAPHVVPKTDTYIQKAHYSMAESIIMSGTKLNRYKCVMHKLRLS